MTALDPSPTPFHTSDVDALMATANRLALDEATTPSRNAVVLLALHRAPRQQFEAALSRVIWENADQATRVTRRSSASLQIAIDLLAGVRPPEDPAGNPDPGQSRSAAVAPP